MSPIVKVQYQPPTCNCYSQICQISNMVSRKIAGWLRYPLQQSPEHPNEHRNEAYDKCHYDNFGKDADVAIDAKTE